MKDITGREIAVGDTLVCTDYNQSGLWLGVAKEVKPGSVDVTKLFVRYGSDDSFDGHRWYTTKKTSSTHLFVVLDESSVASSPVTIGTETKTLGLVIAHLKAKYARQAG